jgi:hypothetical protein
MTKNHAADVIGDYNKDGTVDVSGYVLYRKYVRTTDRSPLIPLAAQSARDNTTRGDQTMASLPAVASAVRPRRRGFRTERGVPVVDWGYGNSH